MSGVLLNGAITSGWADHPRNYRKVRLTTAAKRDTSSSDSPPGSLE